MRDGSSDPVPTAACRPARSARRSLPRGEAGGIAAFALACTLAWTPAWLVSTAAASGIETTTGRGGGSAVAETPLASPDPSLLDPYPRAATAYLVVVDGIELWGRAPDRALAPASLTKLMTALVLLERWEPEAIVTVGSEAAAATGSRIGLRAGDRLRLADAFDALLVASANDACLALAEHAAGSVERFVERMNRRAEALALRATRFRNPCGLDAPGHVSSARDLHRLAREAMAQPEIARAAAKPGVELRTLGGRRLAKPSGNHLLGRVPGAVGIKSGFTRRAGKCLAALVRRGADEVVVILLDAPDRWWAASILIEDAFAALAAARR